MKTIAVADFNCLQSNHQTPGMTPLSAPAQISPYGSNDVYADGYNSYDCCYNYYAPYVAYNDTPGGYDWVTYYIWEDYEYWAWVDAYGNITDPPEEQRLQDIPLEVKPQGKTDDIPRSVELALEEFNNSPHYSAMFDRIGEKRMGEIEFVYDPAMTDRNGEYYNEINNTTGTMKEIIYIGPGATFDTFKQEVFHVVDFKANGALKGNAELSYEVFEGGLNRDLYVGDDQRTAYSNLNEDILRKDKKFGKYGEERNYMDKVDDGFWNDAVKNKRKSYTHHTDSDYDKDAFDPINAMDVSSDIIMLQKTWKKMSGQRKIPVRIRLENKH